MLSESQIEKLTESLIGKFNKLGIEIIHRYGTKIKEIKEADSTSTSLIKLRAVKTEANEFEYLIDRRLQEYMEEMFAILMTVAVLEYQASEDLYKHNNAQYTPFYNNVGVQNAIKGVTDEVRTIFNKLFKQPGFVIRDLKNPETTRAMSVSETYQSIVEEAVQNKENPIDFDVAMRKTEEQLINSGFRSIYVDPVTGRTYTQRLDVAAQNNMLDAVSMIQTAVQLEMGKQFGADGVELSAHEFSALDHEPFQGHQFTLDNWEKIQSSFDFEDINGQWFMGVERIIGVWNCRHYPTAIIIGYSKPKYSNAELANFIENNRVGYKLSNGKHLTMYECTQRQRRYETSIRQAREGLYFAKTADNDMLQEKYKALLANRIARYETFSTECGLPVQLNRTNIVTE